MEAHIIITGIISLINMGAGAGYLALAQDARVPAGSVHGSEPHYATILVERDHVRDVKGLKVRAFDTKYVAYDVNNYEIVIENAVSSGSVVRETSYEDSVLKMTYSEVPNSGKASKRRLIGARLPFSVGTLEAAAVTNDAWQFSRSKKPAKNLAYEVCLKVELTSPALALSFRQNGTEIGRLLVDSPSGQNVEIRFQNLPEDETLPQSPQPPQDEDHHISMYFNLMHSPPAGPPHLERLKRGGKADGSSSQLHSHRMSRTSVTPEGASGDIRSIRVACTPSDWDDTTTP